MKFLGCLLLLTALLCTGCSSYLTRVEPERPLSEVKRYFVKSNFHDNHGIDARLVRALEARGVEVDKGPMTMLPRSAEVIVTYDDRWNWDFRTHMTYLHLLILDARTEKPIASATFSGAAALTTSPDEVIDRLLNKLLPQASTAKK